MTAKVGVSGLARRVKSLVDRPCSLHRPKGSVIRLSPRFACKIAWTLGTTIWTLFSVPVASQAERLPLKRYTTADGLARDYVNRIKQDSRGFLWFCTSEGLSRFDGYNFKNYGTEQGLAGRWVSDLLETRSGVYWVGTNKGLCRFVPEASGQEKAVRQGSLPQRFVVYYPGHSEKSQIINSIYEDRAGVLWCCTEGGLYRVDRNGGEPVFSLVDVVQPASDVENSLRVESVLEDRKGAFWIVAQSGLYRWWPNAAVERYTEEEGLPEEGPRAAIEDRDGRIWVAFNGGISELVTDPQPHRSVVARLYTVKDGLASDDVFSLCQSSDGTLWSGSSGGLTALRSQPGNGGYRIRAFTEANGLARSAIISLCEDRDHNLWVGAESGGVMKLAAAGLVTYDERDGLGKNLRVASIILDRAGALYCITSETVSRLDAGRFTTLPSPRPAGVSSWGWGWYQVLFQDSASEWWLSTNQGLVRYAGLEQIKTARPRAVYAARDGLPTDHVFRVFEDGRHDIWISTLGDSKAVLTRWERASGTFHTYRAEDGIPQAAPTAFSEDSAGNLWIGFYDGGLVRYKDGHFAAFTTSDGVPPGMVRALYLDRSQRLWVATAEGGVARLDEPAAQHPTFVTYSAADGLSSNQANCITEDNWGMIYIGTGRGLDKLDPATGRMRHYSTEDGLAGSLVNVSLRSTDGSLWFGTLQGLSRLIPQPEQPTGPSAVFVTALTVAGVSQPISELGTIGVTIPELGPTQNNIQIDFSGLNLAAGESLMYQYRLEGGASDWSAPTDQRSITYANLAPGSYRFLVRVVGSEGSVTEPPASVTFRILAPFWRRWWFVATAFIAFGAALYGLHRYRVRRYLEVERIRTRIATDLHDDIGSSLSQVSVLSEVAGQRARANLDPSEPLAVIADLSRGVLDSIGDIVWAINPGRDRLSDLTQRMRRFTGDAAGAANIELDFNTVEERPDLKLGPDLRREVYLIFKESVNNLMRHSGCTAGQVTLKTFDRSLELVVSDNGRGFEPERATDGNGLASLKQRAARLGGTLQILARPGSGTSVRLLVPFGRNPRRPRR